MSLKKANTSGTNQAIQTVAVINELGADKELVFTVKNSSAEAAVNNVKLFSPLSVDTNATGGTTFSSGEFASFAEMQKLFGFIATNVSDVIIQTNDTDNFVGSLNVSEKDPTGFVSTVKVDLSKYRQVTGGGYGETIKVPLNVVLWPGLSMNLSQLAPNSSVTFRFKVHGWNKVQELVALKSNVL